MNVSELNNKIAIVNASISRINEQRNRNLGILETLTSQKDKAIKEYYERYGVDLSSVSITEVEAQLLEAKAKEVSVIETVLERLNTGDYVGAQALLNGDVDTVQESASNTDATLTPAPVVHVESALPPNVQMTGEVPVIEDVVIPTMPNISVPQTPVAPNVPDTTATPVVPLNLEALGTPQGFVTSHHAQAGVPLSMSVPNAPTPPTSQVSAEEISIPSMPNLGNPTVVPSVQGVGLDLSALGVPQGSDSIKKATDFAGGLSGGYFDPSQKG